MKLRLVIINIQPVVVWDDGENLTPGPTMEVLSLGLDGLKDFVDKFPGQLDKLAEDIKQSNMTKGD